MADQRFNEVVGGIRKRVDSTLPRLMQDLFEHLDDDLYELAGKSSDDALETRYFEALRELRMARSGIEQAFVGGVFGEFDRFCGLVNQPAGADASSLDAKVVELEMSLVEDEDLEEELAVNAMAAKANNRYQRTLYALNQRFAHLLELDEAEADEMVNPLAPLPVAHGFSAALSQWDGETELKLLVYKLFERYVLGYVGGMYDDINSVLVKAGVLPEIAQQIRRHPVAPSVARQRGIDGGDEFSDAPMVGEGDAGVAGNAIPGLPVGEEILTALSGLLTARRESPEGAMSAGKYVLGGLSPSLPEVPTAELMGALNDVQQTSISEMPMSLQEVQAMQDEVLKTLGRQLNMQDANGPNKRLGNLDRDVMDVVGMLFDFILGDENLPEAMKALLGRLQIPLLKVAVKDRTFFSSHENPARALLNNLARAGIAWTDDGDRSANSVYGRVEHAVTRILTDFVDDVSIFEAVNNEFTSYVERESRGAMAAEQRVTQVKRGQEQLELARSRVAEVIRGYIDSCVEPECLLPAPVLEIINDGWYDVMLLAYLREGENSEAWKEDCTVVEQLIWSVQPKVEQTERQRLLKAIPDLLKTVRKGLVNISFDQHRSTTLFKQLQACHIAALRGARVKAEKNADEALSKVSAAEAVCKAVVPEQQRDEFDDAALALEVGSWLEWTDADGHGIRGKLSWRSEVSGSCVFVDRRGAKLAEMPLQDVAAMLRNDSAKALDNVETPLMDRALGAMLDVLQRTAGEPEPAAT